MNTLFPLRFRDLCLLALFGLVAPLHAASTVTLNSFTIDYRPDLIASDALQGGPPYDRDSIHLASTVSYSASPSNQYSFELRFSLRDSNGNPVQVYNASNTPDSAYRITQNFAALGAGVSQIYQVNLRPVIQLSHLNDYTPHLEIYEVMVGGLSVAPSLKASQAQAPANFHHYTSTNAADSQLNVLAKLDSVHTSQPFMVNTAAAAASFKVAVAFSLFRHDDFFASGPPPSDPVKLRFSLSLTSSGGTVIPLANPNPTAIVSMPRYSWNGGASPSRSPASANFSENVSFAPSTPASLVIGETYTLTVTLAHEELPGSNAFTSANQGTTAASQLRYLSGKLFFGSVLTTLSAVTYVEVPGSIAGGIATGLLIPAAGGGSVGPSGHSFGGTPLTVAIHANGDAFFTGTAPGASQAQVMPPTTPDIGSVGAVQFERLHLTLSTGGAQGELVMCLPQGLGYTLDPVTKLLQHRLPYPGPIAYSGSLQPLAASLTFAMTSDTWFCEESKPLLFDVAALTWSTASGQISLQPVGPTDLAYVRRDELDYLESVVGLANSDGPLKRANDLYWRRVASLGTPTLEVQAGPDGDALLSFAAALDNTNAHSFISQFPYGAQLTWQGPAGLTIDEDQIDPSASQLTGVDPIALSYARDCGGLDCGSAIGPATLTLNPDGGVLNFTHDGGLIGAVDLGGAVDITWGYIPAMAAYAQSALAFQQGGFALTGHFQRGASLTVPADRGPGSVLLSGSKPSGEVSERPVTAAYDQGNAWYAGLNLQVDSDGAEDGHSVLAGNTAIPNYPLTHRSKYYLRLSGVSGIHQAVSGTFLPPDIYGYAMSFDEFGMSYLDSQQQVSVSWGNLDIPNPSAFNLDFTNVRVDCLGAVTGADIDQNLDKVLAYWNGDFTPLSLAFARDEDAACDPGTGFLALGVSASVSHIDDLFYGTLGFKSDGNLITAHDALVAGLDSQLAGPNRVHFAGTDSEVYSLDLAHKLYYNNKDEAGGAEGFLNLVGRLDVPFFQDMKVHLQTRGDKDSTIAPLYLMGGWPNHGYGSAATNFFTAADFDDDHRGYAGASLAGYRDSGGENYLPRAQQDWLSVIHFDYPMKWSDFDRRFASQGAHHNRFLIVDVDHDLPTLSARSAEMTFGASWDGLPFLSLAGLANQLVDDQLMRPFRAAVDEGKDAMAQMLSDQVQKMFDPILDELLSPLVGEVYDELQAQYQAQAQVLGTPPNQLLPFAQWQTVYNDVVTCYLTGGTLPVTSPVDCPLDTSLLELLQNLDGAVDDVSGLLAKIDTYLEKTELVLDAFTSSFHDPEGRILSDTQGMFVCDNAGNIDFAFAEELLKRLLANQDIGIDPALLGSIIDSTLHPLLEEKIPTLKKLAEKLLKLKNFIHQLREQLATASDFVANIHDQLQLLNTQINSVVTTVDGAVQGFFTELESLSTLAGSPFDEYTKAEFEDFMLGEIKDAFYSSEIGTRLQVVLKQQLFDTNGAICQGIDNVFAELNKVIRDLLTAALQDLDESIVPFLDKLNGVIGTGKLTGYAHIVDDAIRYARMDAHLEWSVPEKMDFDGFIEIKQLNAEGSGNACYANAPGVINEVTVGANHVPINWGAANLKADIYAKATFETSSGLQLLGVGGGFEMVEGEIKFEKFTITELGAALSLGEREAFLAAKAHATFSSVEAGIGAFFGKTCTIEPLAMVDADVASLIGGAPFTGAYLYGEAWLPIFDYGCPLRLSAGAGIGLGYFKEGPTYIGKMKLGISGEAICVVSVRGELVLVGVKQGSDFKFKGTGTIEGSVGKCKWFCIKFKKSITVEK